MADTFGARVRKHREQQGISLESIAIRTKIKASLLAGLERDDIAQWPSGIFRRAYARAYAEAIGLDADATLREFVALYPDPVDVLPPPTPEPTRLRRLFESTFGSFSRQRPSAGPAVPREPAPQPFSPAPASALDRTPSSAPLETDESLQPVASTEPAAAAQPVAAPPMVAPPPAIAKTEPVVDLLGAARLCTQLGCVTAVSDLVPLLRDAAKLLGARGLIVWTSDAAAGELRPAIIHGYPDKVRARLRPVKADDDNATAAAFRSRETRAVASGENGRSALAVPLLSAAGCAGVLAIELAQDRAEIPAVQAMATFIAAVLAQLIAGPESGERSGDGSDRKPDRGERRARTDRTRRAAENGARTA